MSIFTAGRHSNTVFEASQQPLASTDSLYMCSPTGWQVVACRCKEVTLLQWKTSLWFLRSPVVCTNTDQRVLKQWKVWCKAETVKVKLASFEMWWCKPHLSLWTLCVSGLCCTFLRRVGERLQTSRRLPSKLWAIKTITGRFLSFCLGNTRFSVLTGVWVCVTVALFSYLYFKSKRERTWF